MSNGVTITRLLPHKNGLRSTAKSVNRRAESVKMPENEAKRPLLREKSNLE